MFMVTHEYTSYSVFIETSHAAEMERKNRMSKKIK